MFENLSFEIANAYQSLLEICSVAMAINRSRTFICMRHDDCDIVIIYMCGESAVPGVCIDLTAERLIEFTRYVGQRCHMFAGRFRDCYSMSCLAAKSTDSTFLSDKVEILFLPMFSEYDDTEMIWFRVPSASSVATSFCCHVLCFCATYCARCHQYLGEVVTTTTWQRQLPI